ncbi:MAG: DUF927 domain-containing protein [Planctomycetota bacterium]|nr:DUF927 domain-containing protein [Planctomycetota bacterium]
MNSVASSHGKNKSKEETPVLVLAINDRRVKLTGEDLQSEETVDQVRQEVASSPDTVRVSLAYLLKASHEDRFRAIDFLVSLNVDCTFHGEQKQVLGDDLFGATLQMLRAPDDLQAYERAKLAAIETAALCYPDALDGACNRILGRLRELGVKGIKSSDLMQQAREILKHIRKPRPTAVGESCERRVCEVFPDSPAPAESVVPPGWELSETGIRRLGDDADNGTIPLPLVVVGRCLDVENGTELMEVAWCRDGQWTRQTAERVRLAAARTIVDELAPFGAPVTSNNAPCVVQYLADSAHVNSTVLPVVHVTHRLGWQGDNGSDGFLWGSTIIVGPPSEALEGQPEPQAAKVITFAGHDEGDDQIAAGFTAAGTLDGWLAAVAPIADFPVAKFMFYTGFAPPLLDIFGADNFVAEIAGPTTGGKTTTLRVVGSEWGCPDERRPNAVVKTWTGTKVFRERVPSVVHSLPTIFDETKHVEQPEDVAKMIYLVAQGVGKGRGTTKGIARQATFRTILFSSGEQTCTSFTKDGGTQVRAMTLWGSPFGEISPDVGKIVSEINLAVLSNYGHAGPIFVQFLLDNRAQWDDWRSVYRDLVRDYEHFSEGNPYARRQAPMLATIHMASWLVHQAIELPWDAGDPIEPVWDQIARETSDADRAGAALRHVMGWAASNQNAFYCQKHYRRQPNQGWAGRWDYRHEVQGEIQESNWEWIGFSRGVLTQVLCDGGFDAESMTRTWFDRGWLKVTEEASGKCRREYKTRIGNTSSWVVAIRRTAIEELDAE